MKHLSANEILGFVSLKKADTQSVAVSAAVNSHIRQCGECLERVRAFQRIYDAFASVGISPEEYMPEEDFRREDCVDTSGDGAE